MKCKYFVSRDMKGHQAVRCSWWVCLRENTSIPCCTEMGHDVIICHLYPLVLRTSAQHIVWMDVSLPTPVVISMLQVHLGSSLRPRRAHISPFPTWMSLSTNESPKADVVHSRVCTEIPGAMDSYSYGMLWLCLFMIHLGWIGFSATFFHAFDDELWMCSFEIQHPLNQGNEKGESGNKRIHNSGHIGNAFPFQNVTKTDSTFCTPQQMRWEKNLKWR